MADPLQINLLKQIYKTWVLTDMPMRIEDLDFLSTSEDLDKLLNMLEISGLVKIKSETIAITPAGRSKIRVVLTGGVYDLLHKGHIITLKEARSLGDFLIVVVARDVTVSKKKRSPIHSDVDRCYLLNAICVVDAAVLGDEVDHMRIVRRIKPEIVAIGSDQDHLEEVLTIQLKDQGMDHTKIIRLQADYEDLATTNLINSILHRYENSK
ncbi:MAG: adenylyltransferase/cytidyltransferase family protein [Candidatus Heimdallarchaeota archaeon]|nr:adenylyltransferase/cytidyltransferase family protein [Candidatus Heimdallarchaeota archaeon]